MRGTTSNHCPVTDDLHSDLELQARLHESTQSRVDAGRDGGAGHGGATRAVTRRAFIKSLGATAALAGATLYGRSPFGVPMAHAAIRRPEEFKHFYAQLPGIKIHYVREGSGPALVLMHGWPASGGSGTSASVSSRRISTSSPPT